MFRDIIRTIYTPVLKIYPTTAAKSKNLKSIYARTVPTEFLGRDARCRIGSSWRPTSTRARPPPSSQCRRDGALELGLCGIGGAFEDSRAQDDRATAYFRSREDHNRENLAKTARNTLPTIPNIGLARDRIATRLDSLSFPPSKTRANPYYLAAKPVF